MAQSLKVGLRVGTRGTRFGIAVGLSADPMFREVPRPDGGAPTLVSISVSPSPGVLYLI